MSTLLKIENLVKKFNNKVILNRINLQVEEGEVVVILGPSGCGKSTFLRCLNGLERIDEGNLYFQNKLIINQDWLNIRQKIGMVFQSYDLFPNMNVIDNILLGPTKVQKRNRQEVIAQADELLFKVGLLDKKNSFPRELSGGQKQRIAIIRALCMNPQIMLFDEVTASLDPEMVREVLEVIRNLAAQGMTMLIVTHEMNFARQVAHRIVFMDYGEIIEISNPDTFFDNPKSNRAKKFLSILDY